VHISYDFTKAYLNSLSKFIRIKILPASHVKWQPTDYVVGCIIFVELLIRK